MGDSARAETLQTSTVRKDTRSQMLDVQEKETKIKEKGIKREEVIEHKDSKSSSYNIMIINMNANRAPQTPSQRRERIVSIIGESSCSVIFCQELPWRFKDDVVEKCKVNEARKKIEKSRNPVENEYSYKFVPEFVRGGDHAAVMWRDTDFQGDEIVESPDVDATVLERSAMVKLTSRKTGASFLAVSWHGPRQKSTPEKKEEIIDALIGFAREVCEKEDLSSFIIGGDFNYNTSKLKNPKGTTIARYELCNRDENQRDQSFVRFKDTFIVSTVPSDERPMTGDNITLSSVRQVEFERSQNALMDHVPVVGELRCIKQDREDTSTTNQEDRPGLTPELTMARKAAKDSRASNAQKKLDFEEDTSTTNQEDRPGLTPELTTARKTAKDSRASNAQKKLDFEVSRPSSSQSPSAIHDGHVTREDFKELLSLVKSIHAKVDLLTAEVEEIKLAIKRPDGPQRSVSAQEQPTESHSQTSPVLEQGSDRESSSEEQKKGKKGKK